MVEYHTLGALQDFSVQYGRWIDPRLAARLFARMRNRSVSDRMPRQLGRRWARRLNRLAANRIGSV
jgi:hypothetical protein